MSKWGFKQEVGRKVIHLFSILFLVIYLIFDKAFNHLNIAVDKKLGGMNFIKSKHWRDLHDDPRYIEILKRMNLPLD